MKREKMAYKLKKELDHQRYEHTLGVEETARAMARVFGVDEEQAALAGLLHDCAKCMPLAQMLKAANNVSLGFTAALIAVISTIIASSTAKRPAVSTITTL